MKLANYKNKLEIIRDIIRETLLGNMALALLAGNLFFVEGKLDGFFNLLHVYGSLFFAVVVFIWLFVINYMYFELLVKNHIIRGVFYSLWMLVVEMAVVRGVFSYLA